MSLKEAHEICTKMENVILDKFGFISTVHAEPIEW
jgi:divalent metal cation (Fe/Co/Zn/Cd) transporter